MLSQDEKRKLKKNAALYARMPVQLQIDTSNQHYSQIQNQKALIILGEQAPYRYLANFHPQGYAMFMEGLELHELASLLYTDFQVLSHVYQKATEALDMANQSAKAYLNKEIKYRDLKDILFHYVYQTNLPLVLKAIEEGAVENAMGIEYPETWNALMYARQAIILAFMKENHNHHDTSFLMDKIIKEIMAICTYGYRFKLNDSIVYLPRYLHQHFTEIRKLAIKGRLQTHNTTERLEIAQMILQLCSPIMEETVKEIIDTIQNGSKISGISNSLFSQMSSEIAVQFQNNTSNDTQPQETPTKYKMNLSDEEFQRIESLENEAEKTNNHQILQDIHRREEKQRKQSEKRLQTQTYQSTIEQSIVLSPLERTTPTQYGIIALRSQHESIVRSNKLARLFKRERMYASKSRTKHRLEYGRHLDQQNLYRATLDGRVFKEHKQGQKKDLCVYILVDTSESMSGEKIINTMKGCFELARVLQTLKIPFCISSHKALGQTKVQLTEIISFQDCQKRYMLDRIFAMHTSGGTHEDIALEYILKKLAEYKRQRKGFVFVLSDGDTHGVEHIHELTHLYKKDKNIDVIGIGIQTAPLITKTYPNSLFIEDIQTLPDMLINKLKEIAI